MGHLFLSEILNPDLDKPRSKGVSRKDAKVAKKDSILFFKTEAEALLSF